MILITIKNSKTFGLVKELIVEEDKQNDVARLKQKNTDKNYKKKKTIKWETVPFQQAI